MLNIEARRAFTTVFPYASTYDQTLDGSGYMNPDVDARWRKLLHGWDEPLARNVAHLKGELVFISAPYSVATPELIQANVDAVCEFDAKLLVLGLFTVTPISKHFALHYGNIPGSSAHWEAYSRELLRACKAMIILMRPGWRESSGVRYEIDEAYKRDIEIIVAHP